MLDTEGMDLSITAKKINGKSLKLFSLRPQLSEGAKKTTYILAGVGNVLLDRESLLVMSTDGKKALLREYNYIKGEPLGDLESRMRVFVSEAFTYGLNTLANRSEFRPYVMTKSEYLEVDRLGDPFATIRCTLRTYWDGSNDDCIRSAENDAINMGREVELCCIGYPGRLKTVNKEQDALFVKICARGIGHSILQAQSYRRSGIFKKLERVGEIVEVEKCEALLV